VTLQPSRPGRSRLPGGARRIADSVEGRVLRAFSSPLLVLVVVACMVVVNVAFSTYGLRLPLRTDYLAMLAGARVLGAGGCLYCHAAQVHAEAVLLGVRGAAFDPFLETPLVALAYRPLAALPASAGFALFVVCSLCCTAAAGVLLWRRVGLAAQGTAGAALLALTLISLPAAWNYHLGQVDGLLVLPLVGGAVLLGSRRPLAAGLLLSLTLLKPQIAWLVPIALLAAGEWRAVVGMVIGVACWGGASVWLVGPEGIGQWLSLLGTQGPAVATSVGVPGAFAGVGGNGLGFAVAAGLAAVACVWLVWRRRWLAGRPLYALALGVAASLLLAPHVYAYDLIALALPLAVLGRRTPAAALVAALLLNAAYLVDTFFVVSGPHLEALALLLIVALLVAEPPEPSPVTLPRPGRGQAPVVMSTTTGA
jgi:hypothetical protein